MKLKISLLRSQVVWLIAATLSLPFHTGAQTFGIGTETSSVFQVVDYSIGANTTYNCSATISATMSPYVTQNGSYNFKATITANCSYVSGPGPGLGVLIFGQNGALSHSTSIAKGDTLLNPIGFGGTSLIIGLPDFWNDFEGDYTALYQDYNRDANSTINGDLSFGVDAVGLGLSITPVFSDHTILLAGLPNTQSTILMTNNLSGYATGLTQTRFSGVFEDGDYVTLNNIGIYDNYQGAEIGYVTLTVPLTGAHTYYNYVSGGPTVDSFTQGPTMTVQVPYVRDQSIPAPTVSVTQSANQVQVGQTVTLYVKVSNNSQAVTLGYATYPVVVSINYDNSYFYLPPGGNSQQVPSISPNSAYTFSFPLVAQAATPSGGSSPTVSITAGWGSPATTKQNYAPPPKSANQPIVVTLPTTTISASSGSGGSISPSGSFAVTLGSSQTFTATPNANYVVNQWLVDGNVVQSSGTTYTLSNIQSSHNVQVTFTAQYTINSSAGSGGSVNPSGSFKVNAGANQSFIATANANYVVNQWLLDGSVVQTGGTSYALNNIQSGHSVQVTFTPIQYTLNASAGSGGSISPNGIFSVNAGASQTFTATANANYVVNQWLLDGNVVQTGGTSYTLNNIQAGHSVQVTFTFEPITYTISASAGSGGNINPSGSFTVSASANQTFTATANANYAVNQWLLDGSVVQTGGTSYTLSNIQAAHSVQVTFAPIQYTLNASAGSGGSISPNGIFSVNAGASQTFTATANASYVVNQWLLDGSVVQTGGTSYALNNIQAGHAVQVTFTYATTQYTISTSAGSGGSINPNGSFTVSAGANQTLIATANANYAVNQWLLDGSVVQTGGTSYTLSNIQAAHSVQVTFAPIQYTLNASAGSGGSISPNGIFSVNAGASQTFTATANASYVVNQWLLDGSVVQTGGTSYALNNIQAGHAVQVTFTYATTQYTISASAGSGGSINPSGSFTVSAGSNQTLTATANANYIINQWYVDSTVMQVGGTTYTIYNIQAGHSVEVTFTYILTNAPQITNVVFSGSAGNYTITVSGLGLGNLTGLPFTGDTTNLSLVDFTQLGHAEWGYAGDGNVLTYQSWSDNQLEISGFGGQPGDAITIAIWNPSSGGGATWGGNVPGGSGTPQISSVTFTGSGTNLQMYINGSGFGSAPTNLPFTGDVNDLIFQDHFTHSGMGDFEAGGNIWGVRSADAVTLQYQSWSANQIVIGGFGGSYGQGNNVLQIGDPVTIVVWNSSDTSDAGPQTAWGGVVSDSVPQITNVVFSGSAGNYTITVSGSGLGNLTGLPFTGDTTNLSLVDFTELGHAEWGYAGDGNVLTYQSWSDNQLEISGFGGQPGDAITIAIWNPETGAGATWGGNVPGGSGTPQISSVTFTGSGTNMQMYINGSGFGSAPAGLPFTGDLNQLIFQDHFTHSGIGDFEAGGNIWGIRSADAVTLQYQSWSDTQIVISGFGGSYGQGNNVLQIGDPVTIVVWNSSDTGDTGPQTAWGGVVSPEPPPHIANVVFTGSSGNYTLTVSGVGFGSLEGLPFTGDTTNLSLVDFTQLGHAEWGYSGDYNILTYQSWSDNQVQISGFGGQPGDAITIAIWNPVTGAAATWGGNVPGGSGAPQISSVTFAGSGTNLQIYINGSGFGSTPAGLPFTGDLNQFIFQDHFTHSGAGDFEAGGNIWGIRSDFVTLQYQSWSDNQIVISGFGGSYGQGNNVLQNGDPFTIVVWNASATSDAGPQTAWGGFVSAVPLLGIGSPPLDTAGYHLPVFAPAGSNIVVQVSADLVNWTNIYTNSGSFIFTDPSATNYNQRFYRVMMQ